MADQTGPEIVAAIAELGASGEAMDTYMRRDPAAVTMDQRRAMIDHWRLERAQWILKGEKKGKKGDTNDDDNAAE